MASVMAKDVQNVANCRICRKQKSSSLKCQHAYCESCLVEWKLKDPSYSNFSCPTCRICYIFQFGGTKQMKEPHCEVCSGSLQSPTPVKAASFCRNCQDCMCPKCGEAHKKFPSFKNHNLVTIKEFKNNAEFCKYHHHKTKDFYCEECDILLCSLCATRSHQQHLEFVHNASEYCKGYYIEVARLVEKADKIYDFQNNLKYQDHLLHLKQFEKSITDMKSKVRDHVKTVIEDIKVQESKLLASIDENTATLKTWQDWAEGTKALKPHAEKLSKNCETYFKNKKPADLLVGIKDLYAEVNRGVLKYGEDCSLPEVPVDFIPEQQVQPSIGKIALKGEKYIKSENTSLCDCDSEDAPPQKKQRCANSKGKPTTRKTEVL